MVVMKMKIMRFTFRKAAMVILGVYFLITCYTGYMVIRKKFEKTDKDEQAPKKLKAPVDDLDWNPWGQEFEQEDQKLPAFERPHLILEKDDERMLNESKPLVVHKAMPRHDMSTHVVEIWGKAAISLYLWEHIMGGTMQLQANGMWTYGTQTIGNIHFRFRTGPWVVPEKVPADTRNVVLVLNGREASKIKVAVMWLDFISQLTQLINVAVVLLGNEQCNNEWLHPYMVTRGGPIKAVFLVYDSPEIDDQNFFQWPLGVATYRHFPLVIQKDSSASLKRTYLCNFLGTIYPNSSRSILLSALQQTQHGSRCFIHGRTQWLPEETSESRQMYIQALTDSDLTLNPVGMNVECYRIFEALSLGSVPVVEDIMTPGNCGGRNRTPLRLLKQYGAPLLYITNWTTIGDVLNKEYERPLKNNVKRRYAVLNWYADFLSKMKTRFVSVLQKKFFV